MIFGYKAKLKKKKMKWQVLYEGVSEIILAQLICQFSAKKGNKKGLFWIPSEPFRFNLPSNWTLTLVRPLWVTWNRRKGVPLADPPLMGAGGGVTTGWVSKTFWGFPLAIHLDPHLIGRGGLTTGRGSENSQGTPWPGNTSRSTPD